MCIRGSTSSSSPQRIDQLVELRDGRGQVGVGVEGLDGIAVGAGAETDSESDSCRFRAESLKTMQLIMFWPVKTGNLS